MIPIDKVREIISKHRLLEKELSSDKVDKKNYAKISKEYSDLNEILINAQQYFCLLYTSPSPRDRTRSRMPSSA